MAEQSREVGGLGSIRPEPHRAGQDAGDADRRGAPGRELDEGEVARVRAGRRRIRSGDRRGSINPEAGKPGTDAASERDGTRTGRDVEGDQLRAGARPGSAPY